MFVGIGGLQAGLTRVDGFQCVEHCEIDKYVEANYCAIRDIGKEERYYPGARAINPNDLPDFSLLCEGFSRQAFPLVGHRKGFDDARDILFFETTHLAEIRRPSYLLPKDVPGLLNHDGGRTLVAILSALSDPGHYVEWAMLDSKHFGVSQSRRRVFFICYLGPRCVGKTLPVFGNGTKALIQLIGGVQGHRVYDSGGVACTQTVDDGGLGVKTGLYLLPPDTPFVDPYAGHPRWAQQSRHITARYGQTMLFNHKVERSGALLIKETTQKDYQEVTPGDSMNSGYPSSAIRAGRVGVGVAHDAASVQGTVERGGRIRRPMPREYLYLQGFDDEQVDKVLAINSDVQTYKQAGNSVIVTVIEVIGRCVRAVDEVLRKEAAARPG